MSDPLDAGPAALPPDDRGPRLDSWKAIAAHLGRDIRTVQRWERGEGLPVHRHLHDKLGSVYAFGGELDRWRSARSTRPDERAAERGSEVAADPLVPDTVHDEPVAPVLSVAPPARPSGAHWMLFAGLAVMAALGAWLVAGSWTDRDDQRAPITSIVVLPFENLSADPAQEFFAAGLTEEITSRLARLSTLRVVSRTSAWSVRDRKLSVPEIARDVQVDAVVEGSVRREAGRVRITIQLIHAPTDRHLWARDFEGVADAVWPLQIEVAQAVADEIRGHATPPERARLVAAPPFAPAAHEEYLLGRYLLWKFVAADRAKAIDHFQRAIELQPDHPAPYAALAHAWWMRGVFGERSLREVSTPARDAATAALAREADNVEALAALAYVEGMFDWDWDRARATIGRAVALEPNNVDARYVSSLLLMALGRLDDAAGEIDAAARLDPLSAQVHSTYGRILYRARRFDEARVRLQRALELEPRNAGTYARLAEVLERMGEYDRALALVDQADAQGTMSYLPLRARVLASAGRTDAARTLLRQVPPASPQRAPVLAALGDRALALESLVAALDRRESWLPFIKNDPVFEQLHDDPRWSDVLSRMHLR